MSIRDSLNRTFSGTEEFGNVVESSVLAEINNRIQPLLNEISALRGEVDSLRREISAIGSALRDLDTN